MHRRDDSQATAMRSGNKIQEPQKDTEHQIVPTKGGGTQVDDFTQGFTNGIFEIFGFPPLKLFHRLGSLLVSILDPFGCPISSKFGTKSPLDSIFWQNKLFSRNAVSPRQNPILRPQDGSTNDPRWLQYRFKTILTNVFVRLRFLLRCWSNFG